MPAAARFCPTCGRPVDPEFGPPAPPAAPPIWSGVRLPRWLTSDWPLVGLGVAVMVALLFAASALYGTVAAVAVAGNVQAAGYGAALGSHLAFAAFGARTAVSFGATNASNLALQFLPLPWALTGGLAMGAALRFARPRLPDDRRRRMAYAAKLAAAGGVVLGIVAGLLDQGSSARAGYRSELNGGEVWFYATVLLLLWGWLWLRRWGYRAGPGWPARFRPLVPRAGEGAVVFVAVAAVFAFVGLVFALVVVDHNSDQVGLLFGVPVVALNFGAAMADVAMGAAVGFPAIYGDHPPGHLSLVHFGLPPWPDAGAAPAWLFVALLVAPAAVGFTVWRRLERSRPTSEQDAFGVGAATAVGFAATAWLLALVGRIALSAAIVPTIGADRGTGNRALILGRVGVSTVVAAQPNPVSVFFLALLWGLAGGLVAAFYWASRHHARWQVTAPVSGGERQEAGAAGEAPEEKP